MEVKKINLNNYDPSELREGDIVEVSGVVYTIRDAACARLVNETSSDCAKRRDCHETADFRLGHLRQSKLPSPKTRRLRATDALLSQYVSEESLPFDLRGAAIFFAGPAATPPGQVVGSIGPTTSARMDAYVPFLLARGVKAFIGKGVRSAEADRLTRQNGAVYFIAIGGAAAKYRLNVTSCELIAYPDLGTEAVYRLTLKNMPLIVGIC